MGRSWVVLLVATVVAGCGVQNTEKPPSASNSTSLSGHARQGEGELAGGKSAPSTAQMTKKEVLLIAEAKAKSEGYDIAKYNMTGCHYEFTHKDRTWTVFYELKPPTPPGGHFFVSVNDQTKEARLAHGE